jgi:threonine dehydrogenase-like Zn-dependent dehydrogenase
MRGIAFTGDSRAELVDVADPVPGTGEVVIEVQASGICGSDLHYLRSPRDQRPDPPVIAGHEPSGIVAARGPGVPSGKAKVGDRVMVHHYTACAACPDCTAGWPQLCTQAPVRTFGKTDHGGHAAYMAVPAATLVPLNDELSFVAGSSIACGTGTAWGGLKRLGDVSGQAIAVFGQGPVGMSVTMMAAALGAEVIAVDIVPERRAQALDFGAAHTVDPSAGDTAQIIRELTRGAGVGLAVETSGAKAAGVSLLGSMATWGRAAFIGLGSPLELDIRKYLTRQLTIMTSYTMSLSGHRECADFVAAKQLPIDALFTDRWSLEQGQQAYDTFATPGSGKGVFVTH